MLEQAGEASTSKWVAKVSVYVKSNSWEVGFDCVEVDKGCLEGEEASGGGEGRAVEKE